jgi:hypothetical protein
MSRGGFDQFGEDGAAGFERVLELEHGRGNSARLGAGEANYSDASAAGRSGDGDDGVVEVHRVILAVNDVKGDEYCDQA